MKLLRPAALAVTSAALVLAAPGGAAVAAQPSTDVRAAGSARTATAATPAASTAVPSTSTVAPAVQGPVSTRVTTAGLPPVVGVGVIIAGIVQAVARIRDAANAGIASDNRVGVLQALKNAAWYEHAEGKNVLVIKNDHPYELHDMQGVVLDAVYTASGNPDFRVVVFDSGRVVNNGDGGYINWAFQGWFDRTSDSEVVFRLP